MLDTQRIACATVAAVAAGRNLNAVLAAVWPRHSGLSAQQRSAITDLCYGTLRYGLQLDAVLDQLLTKPLRDEMLRWLLLVGMYQLQYTRAAPYAIVDHAVRCATTLGQPQAAGLINAILRNFLRRRDALLAAAARTDSGRYAYPQWWISKVRNQYPRHFAAILDAGNLHPPMTLRVNRQRMARDKYLEVLAQHAIAATPVGAEGVTLARALPVERVPGFAQGIVSVQDAAAQNAAPLLDAHPGMHVLDACAAPGGKTTHLLEIANVHLMALDSDATRLERVRQNLHRVGLDAVLRAADVNDLGAWWDGRPFERILADVPCSASGVVRRHPDIKWLRRAGDVARFATQQTRMLEGLWRVLASGGKLLYTTCSIFQEENSLQIAGFLARHADAELLPLCGMTTLDGIPEGQLLPDSEHDGFFYALLKKT